MANIPVEKKSSTSWIWLLLLLLLVGAIIWWLFAEADDADYDDADEVAVEQSADRDSVAGAPTPGDMTLAAILANPSVYYGVSGFSGEVGVDGPITDRGFWIEQNGSRMFALIIDQPAERPKDINDGARLRLDGGTVREPASIRDGEIEGDPLDQDTLDIIAEQDAILVIDEANITISEAA
jgi:hypothetical protein